MRQICYSSREFRCVHSGCRRTFKRKYNLLEHDKVWHHKSVAACDAASNMKAVPTNTRFAYGCGLCEITPFEWCERYIQHHLSHCEGGSTLDEWDAIIAVKCLLNQPGISETWRVIQQSLESICGHEEPIPRFLHWCISLSPDALQIVVRLEGNRLTQSMEEHLENSRLLLLSWFNFYQICHAGGDHDGEITMKEQIRLTKISHPSVHRTVQSQNSHTHEKSKQQISSHFSEPWNPLLATYKSSISGNAAPQNMEESYSLLFRNAEGIFTKDRRVSSRASALQSDNSSQSGDSLRPKRATEISFHNSPISQYPDPDEIDFRNAPLPYPQHVSEQRFAGISTSSSSKLYPKSSLTSSSMNDCVDTTSQ